jgi:hypothetical protein
MKATLGIVKLLGSANVSQTRVGFGCNIRKTLLRFTLDKIVFFAKWLLSVNRYQLIVPVAKTVYFEGWITDNY